MPKARAQRPRWFNGGNGPFPKFVPWLTCGREFRPGPITIYALIDPDDDTVRYIGKTTNPAARLKQHMECKARNYGLRWWLEGLAGRVPRLEVLATCSDLDWEVAERAWISAYAARGEIYNWAPGGTTGSRDPRFRKKAKPKGTCPVCRRSGARRARCQLCNPNEQVLGRIRKEERIAKEIAT